MISAWSHRGHQDPPCRTRTTGLDVVAPVFTPEGVGWEQEEGSRTTVVPSCAFMEQSLRDSLSGKDSGENKV